MVNQQLNSCPASTTTMKNPIVWKKNQAFWIWVINNTQKHARCAHGSSNTPLLCKAPCTSRNMRIQQHKMSLPPLPTTTLAIVMNWVQRMGQILRHGEKVLQIVW